MNGNETQLKTMKSVKRNEIKKKNKAKIEKTSYQNKTGNGQQ